MQEDLKLGEFLGRGGEATVFAATIGGMEVCTTLHKNSPALDSCFFNAIGYEYPNIWC